MTGISLTELALHNRRAKQCIMKQTLNPKTFNLLINIDYTAPKLNADLQKKHFLLFLYSTNVCKNEKVLHLRHFGVLLE